MSRFGKHRWWMVTVLLTAPLIAIAAPQSLTVFQAGTPIKSADVNANFSSLDARITALETAGASHKATTITQVFDNIPGPLPLGAPDAGANTGKFTSTGGQLVIVAGGSAWTSAGEGLVRAIVELDGVSLGYLEVYANEVNSHKSFPTRTFVGAALPAGTHTITILPDLTTATTTDNTDYFSVSVIELGN